MHVFVREYVVDHNGAAAARRPGYSEAAAAALCLPQCCACSLSRRPIDARATPALREIARTATQHHEARVIGGPRSQRLVHKQFRSKAAGFAGPGCSVWTAYGARRLEARYPTRRNRSCQVPVSLAGASTRGTHASRSMTVERTMPAASASNPDGN
jgi:hypothetical protein